jgi:hypothetical protein
MARPDEACGAQKPRLQRGGFEFAGGETFAKIVEAAGEEIGRGGQARDTQDLF